MNGGPLMPWWASPETLTIVRWAVVLLRCFTLGEIMVWADYSTRLRYTRHKRKLLEAEREKTCGDVIAQLSEWGIEAVIDDDNDLHLLNVEPPPEYTGARVGDVINHAGTPCRVIGLRYVPTRHLCDLGAACKARWQPVLVPFRFEETR